MQQHNKALESLPVGRWDFAKGRFALLGPSAYFRGRNL